jgi:hypothetical protein
MKLKIPPASKVFKKNRMPPKKPSLEKVVMEWLNTEVLEAITVTEPKLSTKSLKVTGRVTVEVPYDGYCDSPKEFVLLTKAQLVPIGYDVEFTYDGMGMTRDICIIKWEHTL